MQTQTTQNTSSNNMSAIERALAAAKARKAVRENSSVGLEEASTHEIPAPKPSKPKTPKAEAAPSPDKEARAAARAEKQRAEADAKAAKKAERDAARAARAAEKASASPEKKPAHMKKVERARSKCPSLSGDAEALFGEITANLSAQQIDALAQHLMVHNRASATILATQTPPLPLGALVRITGGDMKYVGLTGEVVHSQKLRAKVKVPGFDKEAYIYNGQAVLVEAETAEAV